MLKYNMTTIVVCYIN